MNDSNQLIFFKMLKTNSHTAPKPSAQWCPFLTSIPFTASTLDMLMTLLRCVSFLRLSK